MSTDRSEEVKGEMRGVMNGGNAEMAKMTKEELLQLYIYYKGEERSLPSNS